MPSVVCNYGESQINFLIPRAPGVAWTESSDHTSAPKYDPTPPSTCMIAHIVVGGNGKADCRPDDGLDNTTSATRTSLPLPTKKFAANGAKSRLRFSDSNLSVEVTDNLFGNMTERQYFDHWLAYRYRLGGGFFDEQLWNETMPQMSRQHASVRYAAMAIGGIAKALRQSLKPMSPAQMGANGPHYALALTYYGRAIREIRNAKLDTSSLRAAIICCLLFVCFEVLHGDRKAAFSHINNGQKMMDDLVRRCEEESPQNQSVIGAESVETDALHVFQRLIQQSWSCGVLRRRDQDASEQPNNGRKDSYSEQPWCCRGGSGRKCAYHKMPSSFATLQEARRWWDVTQHYVTHSSNIVFRVTHLGLGDDFLSECNERIQRHMYEIKMAKAGVKPATAERWQDFKDALDRWHDGFEHLWATARENRYEDEKSYAQAAHLRAHYLTMYGCVHSPLSCSYESIACLTPKYREVVRLCGSLLEYQKRSFKAAEIFTMDMGPTWPLFLAGTRCREAEVRNEAIRLLYENPRRDGLWDSRIFYALTVRNRMLEVSNAQEGTFEEQWWRLQHRSAYVDEQGRLIAKAMDKNPLTGSWDFGEDNLRRFLFD
ncbi:C6 zinc finger domain-containing protein [Colletotrichum tofieldiae]|uniref:C6 zinc finger domain-containing protein n=1 Tax=Colletotrichum tofieldiae TaxID=708197 RepID=A0A166V1C1_9PEZI|nr:C6 zinc finger domain-containing protein [Colletotrichum tofieldiae]GKT61676.1 C6 zinc finger domain-containing protein [Colletotrichum tofieldiae]